MASAVDSVLRFLAGLLALAFGLAVICAVAPVILLVAISTEVADAYQRRTLRRKRDSRCR